MLLLMAGLPAVADIAGLSNTGFGVWTVSGPGITGTILASVISTAPGAWVGNTSTSKWIGPQPNAENGNPPQTGDEGCSPNCNYTYQMSFWVASLDPSAALYANWASDNALLYVNVVNKSGPGLFSTGLDNTLADQASYGSFHTLDLSSGLALGENTLDFVVNNFGYAAQYPGDPNQGWSGANPTGLQVQFTGEGLTVPEPDAVVLLPLMGGALIGLARLFKRRSA